MTLIDSHQISTLTLAVGTLVFTGVLVWAIWFASRMD
jgi:hypothetical protein